MGHATGSSVQVGISITANDRYVLSVLPDADYTIGGATIANLVEDSMSVTVNPLPLATAQISVYVFHDNFLINNVPDLPQDLGVPGPDSDYGHGLIGMVEAYNHLLNCPPGSLDSDGDGVGVGDVCDNCRLAPNGPLIPDAGGNIQWDTDGDGFGNLCDGDLDNSSGIVNFADLALFKAVFGLSDADADFDGNGFVNFADLAIFKSLFGKPRGPAGVLP